jgi:hypothetical protein
MSSRRTYIEISWEEITEYTVNLQKTTEIA